MKIVKNIRRILYVDNRKKLIYITAFVLQLSLIWLMCTPHGAIRCELLFSDGVHAALSAEIKRNREIKQEPQKQLTYSVTVDGIKETWKLYSIRYTYYAIPEKDN